MALTKSEILREMQKRNNDLTEGQIENVVETILTHIKRTLIEGDRIEIRDFAAFRVNHYGPRQARNPKTGERVTVGHRFKPVCHAGRKLSERVNAASQTPHP